MYEFIVLAVLMQGPGHGYLVAKIINDIIGPYASVSSGRLYPLLAKLELRGLITTVDEPVSRQQGNRQLHIYKITDAGRLRFRALMEDISSNPGEYRELFRLKVGWFSYIPLLERLRLIDHYINYCQTHVFHLQTEMEDMQRSAPFYMQKDDHDYMQMDAYSVENIINVMQHMIEQWQHELDWVRSLQKRELERVAQSGLAENP
ncbi:MAG TPA: PadR family transcriptional regulator [Ktedonobacteraceae bacterium]|nr:PadR family transcriptional regulator [Ktedonobacteraceae bacterium]